LIYGVIYYSIFRIMKVFISLFILISCCLMATSQHPNVIIGNSLGYGLPSEPAVCINPSNPDEIMVGAMVDNYYYSTNGGSNWTHGSLQSPWGVQADPCLMFGRSTDVGNSWLPADINITKQHINWIYTIPSVDLGVSFPVITCDRSGGLNNGNIYMLGG